MVHMRELCLNIGERDTAMPANTAIVSEGYYAKQILLCQQIMLLPANAAMPANTAVPMFLTSCETEINI